MRKILQTITIILLVIAIGLALVLVNKKDTGITDLEKSSIINFSDKAMLYIDSIEGKEADGADIYVTYALNYAYNEEDKNTLSIDEIKDIVKKYFDVKLDQAKLEEGLITPTLAENFISYDSEKKEYTLNISNMSYTDIANTEVAVYLFDSATKDKDVYKAIYKKYIISNPYEVLNYYDDLNNDEENTEKYDTTKILNYLKGKEKVRALKEAVKPDMILEVAEYSKSLEIDLVLKNDKLLITSMKALKDK